ncbi:hypothetical protein CY34DRAFT_803999 [Suillus luteus UH-Slu-Lm8-n1]|uniref:Uncharacterized protein n=1 Tax=Suillus luteus UH-Slu-Lm8-n1 TaxID=930992 RepID=A0A0D0BJ22_9AGAM|nr:hypothetical protein CY34DRAFT_803999 [Suillus luteus UH-Slu-Lm8-n1]
MVHGPIFVYPLNLRLSSLFPSTQLNVDVLSYRVADQTNSDPVSEIHELTSSVNISVGGWEGMIARI